MIKVRRRVIKIKDGILTEEKHTKTLTKKKPPSAPIIFRARYCRNLGKSADWHMFFAKIRQEFVERYEPFDEDSIEAFQINKIDRLLNELMFLVVNIPFSRGKARAIEEVLQTMTWYCAAEGEKYRDRFKEMTQGTVNEERAKQYEEMRQLVGQLGENGKRIKRSKASHILGRKYGWSDKKCANFAEAFRKQEAKK